MSLRFISVSKFVMRAVAPIIFIPSILVLQVYLGYEVALFPLYLVPVVQLTWEFGWRGALGSVALSIGVWILGSYWSEQNFSSEGIRYYNAGARGIIFVLAAVFVHLFKKTMENHRRQMEAMKALLNVCHGCGAVQGSDGQWVPLDQLVSHPKSTQCECPSCAAMAAKPHGDR